MTKNPKSIWDGVCSIGTFAAETIGGITDLGVKAKDALMNEVDSLQTEREVENAASRIIARERQIQALKEELNISTVQARKLLEDELNK
jgi:hypothetical protein